jgi:hypothetical protein
MVSQNLKERSALKKTKGKPSQAIEVTDLQEKTITYYNSLSEAARALNIPSYRIISNYILRNQIKPYKKRFTFKVIIN